MLLEDDRGPDDAYAKSFVHRTHSSSDHPRGDITRNRPDLALRISPRLLRIRSCGETRCGADPGGVRLDTRKAAERVEAHCGRTGQHVQEALEKRKRFCIHDGVVQQETDRDALVDL